MNVLRTNVPLDDLDVMRTAYLTNQLPHLSTNLATKRRLTVLRDENEVIPQSVNCMT